MINMEFQRKEYLAVFLRAFSYACFTPMGSVLFQAIVFKKDVMESNFMIAILAMLGGALFLIIGYIILGKNTFNKERKSGICNR